MTTAKKILPGPTGQFPSLVRGDDQNLHIRHFPTAADASAASSLHRELPTPTEVDVVVGRRHGEMRHTAFAKRLGVSNRVIRNAYKRGALPGAKEHSAYILVIPTHLLRLAEAYGLRGVERMAKAGLI